MKKLLFVAALLVGAAVSGCGASHQCCNGGSYYSCTSEAAARACEQQNDYTNCTRNSQKDNACRPT